MMKNNSGNYFLGQSPYHIDIQYKSKFKKVQMYLQWTIIGPSEDVRPLLTRFRKLINEVTSSGTELSGQAVKWNCVTFFTSSYGMWYLQIWKVNVHNNIKATINKSAVFL